MLLICILMIASFQRTDAFKFPGVETIFDLDGYYELLKEVVSKGQFAADRGEAINLFDDRCEVMLGELMGKVDELSEKIGAMESRIMERFDYFDHLLRGIADDVHKKILMHEVVTSIKIVVEKHDQLIAYSKKKKFPKKKFTKILHDNIATGSDGIQEQLQKIHRVFVPGRLTSSFEETILDVMENIFHAKKNERCNEISAQHVLYTLYATIATVELTGFTTLVYSSKLLEKETKNNETDLEIELVTESVMRRMEDYVKTFVRSMKNVERTFRTCDPNKGGHIRDKTFTEMWGLSQGIIMFEWNFMSSRSCSGKCEDMRGLVNNAKKCYKSFYESVDFKRHAPADLDKCPTPRKCYGLIHDCQSLWVSNFCKLKDNTRRYEYIQDSYGNGKTYGQWSNCDDGVFEHSTWDGTSLTASCSECMCLCDDDEPPSLSVHVVSIEESVTDYKNNKVVVGIRFKIQGRALQLQVKEGVIGREHQIDQKTVKWVYLQDVGRDIEISANNARWRARSDSKKEGKHYLAFKIGSAFNMNKIMLPYNRVVVGTRFYKSTRKEPESLHIEIQVLSMEYNAATGKLLPNTEKWEISTEIHDSKIDIPSGIPQDAKTPTVIKSAFNQYVQLRASGWDEDAAQTVLPLFDAQDVETKPFTPFGGLGLHYRGTFEEGGFIGISGCSLDYAGFLDHSEESESPDPKDVVGPE